MVQQEHGAPVVMKARRKKGLDEGGMRMGMYVQSIELCEVRSNTYMHAFFL